MDLTNVGIGILGNKKVKALAKSASSIAQDYYPEQLGQMLICNAPWAFTAVWKIVSGWLDEKTRKKIMLVGKDYKKKLAEFVDDD